MLVAACMRRLGKSIARNGPHANAPSASASAVPKSTGTADAVREKGRASRNHSPRIDRQGLDAFIGPAPRLWISSFGHDPFLAARRGLFCKRSRVFSIEATGIRRLRTSAITCNLKLVTDWLTG